MEKTIIHIDRQATSLLGITLWSNIIVSFLLLFVNAVNLYRAETGSELLIAFASPEMVFIISLALCVWMIFGCVSVVATKRRIGSVFLSYSDECIEGVSMPDPLSKRAGDPFQLKFSEIQFVGITEVPLTKRGTVPSLKISDGERVYVVPALEKLEETVKLISDHMAPSKM